LGVDFNPKVTGLAKISPDGNLLAWKSIKHPELSYLSHEKRQHTLSRVARQIVQQAAAFIIGRRGMGIHKENILRSFQIVLGQYQTNGRKRYWSAKNYSNWGLWKLLTVLVRTKRFQSLVRRSYRATPLRPGSEADLISISVKKKLVRGNNDLDSQTFDPG